MENKIVEKGGNKMKLYERGISFLLALVMCFTVGNFSVFSQENRTQPSVLEETRDEETIYEGNSDFIKYIFIKNSFLSLGDTQKIIVSVKNSKITSMNLFLNKKNERINLSGVKEDSTFVFKSFFEEKGMYSIQKIQYVLEGQMFELD